jgi:hypothetical protein
MSVAWIDPAAPRAPAPHTAQQSLSPFESIRRHRAAEARRGTHRVRQRAGKGPADRWWGSEDGDETGFGWLGRARNRQQRRANETGGRDPGNARAGPRKRPGGTPETAVLRNPSLSASFQHGPTDGQEEGVKRVGGAGKTATRKGADAARGPKLRVAAKSCGSPLSRTRPGDPTCNPRQIASWPRDLSGFTAQTGRNQKIGSGPGDLSYPTGIAATQRL